MRHVSLYVWKYHNFSFLQKSYLTKMMAEKKWSQWLGEGTNGWENRSVHCQCSLLGVGVGIEKLSLRNGLSILLLAELCPDSLWINHCLSESVFWLADSSLVVLCLFMQDRTVKLLTWQSSKLPSIFFLFPLKLPNLSSILRSHCSVCLNRLARKLFD